MDHWAKVKRLHQAALAKDPSQRESFLDEACAEDATVRAEVQSLLAYEHAAAGFMESPALVVAAAAWRAEPLSFAGRTLGHYDVQSLLGAGGMGEVYLARDSRLDRAVALKVLPPDFAQDRDRVERFVREARAASALNHPNVATIYDVGQSDDIPFIAMEYVDGITIAARLADRALTTAEIIDITVQVADALDAAHANGITHRDIKPANVMLTSRGRVKVLDFGIAKSGRLEDVRPVDEPAAEAGTDVGRVIGSVPYMSPEQVLGREVDHLSDLFSLGVTLYEMSTRRQPFTGATPAETMHRILHEEPLPMTEVQESASAALARITFKCLEKSRERRYQTAGELLEDLHPLKRQADDVTDPMPGSDRRHNLPSPLTSFVGRVRETGQVRSLLRRTRLLTLTGAGGCGKTRLALYVTSIVAGEFRDGVWTVDLASLSERDLIAQAVAATLGIRDGPGRSLTDTLVEYFRARHILLVLDNCEHLIDACARIIDPLLAAAPGLHVLVTSREGLGIAGEGVWRVPSLSVPDETVVTPDALLQFESVRLFADRARAVQPAFEVTASNVVAVREICGRLDGIPLAIELAATRLNVLSVDQIKARLNDRLDMSGSLHPAGSSHTCEWRIRTSLQ